MLIYSPFFPRAVVRHSRVPGADALPGGGKALFEGGAAPSSLVLDFGEELVGTFEITGRCEWTGRIDVFYGEDLAEALMTHDPFPESNWYHLPHDVFALSAGGHVLRNPGRRAFHNVNILFSGPGSFQMAGARATLEHASAEDRGSFTCSDPLLNEAWQISRRTIRLCRQDFFEDGIKRDGMLWIGDCRVEALASNYLFGDAAIARRSIEMIAQCQNPDGSMPAAALRAGGHPCARLDYMVGFTEPDTFLNRWILDNYCADFAGLVWEHVLHTGDTDLAVRLGPSLDAVLHYLEEVDLSRHHAVHRANLAQSAGRLGLASPARLTVG